MTYPVLQTPATVLLIVFLVLTGVSIQPASSSVVLNTGTILFSPMDALACCLDTEKYATLVFRQLLNNVISVPLNHAKGDAYVVAFISFVHSSARKAVSSAPPAISRAFVLALFDTVGGYMRTYLLPVTIEGFYAGNVRFNEVRKLFNLYDDVKDFLHTNGNGWKTPMKKYSVRHRVRPLNMTLNNEEEIGTCDNFIFNANYKVTDDASVIPIPFLDDNINPRSVALPLRYGSLHSIDAQESAYLLLGHYVRSLHCLKMQGVSHEDIMDYKLKFRVWLLERVIPHLNDEKWYPAFGGILRVVRETGELQRQDTIKPCMPSSNGKRQKRLSDPSLDVLIEIQNRQDETSRANVKENISDSQNLVFEDVRNTTDYKNGVMELNKDHCDGNVSLKNKRKYQQMFNPNQPREFTRSQNDIKVANDKWRTQFLPEDTIQKDIVHTGMSSKQSTTVSNGNEKKHEEYKYGINKNNYNNNYNVIGNDYQNDMGFGMIADYAAEDDDFLPIDVAILRKFKHSRKADIVTSHMWEEPSKKVRKDFNWSFKSNIRPPRDEKDNSVDSLTSLDITTIKYSLHTEKVHGSMKIGNDTAFFTLLREHSNDNLKQNTNSEGESKNFNQGIDLKGSYKFENSRNKVSHEKNDSIPKKKKLKCGEDLSSLYNNNSSVTTLTGVSFAAHVKSVDDNQETKGKPISKDSVHRILDSSMLDDSLNPSEESKTNVPNKIGNNKMERTTYTKDDETTCITTCIKIPKHKTERIPDKRVSLTTRDSHLFDRTSKHFKSTIRPYTKIITKGVTTEINVEEHEILKSTVFKTTTTHKGVKISKGIVYHQVDKVTPKPTRAKTRKYEYIPEHEGHESDPNKIKQKKERLPHRGRKYEEIPANEHMKHSMKKYQYEDTSAPPKLTQEAKLYLHWPPRSSQYPQMTVPVSTPLYTGLFGSASGGQWTNLTDGCVSRAWDGRHAAAPLVAHLLGDVLQSPVCNLDFCVCHLLLAVLIWLLLLCASMGQEDMHFRWQGRGNTTRKCVRPQSPTNYYSVDGDYSWHSKKSSIRPLQAAPVSTYLDKKFRYPPWEDKGTYEERAPLYSSSKSTSLLTTTGSAKQYVSSKTHSQTTPRDSCASKPPVKCLLSPAMKKFRYSSESECLVSDDEEHTIDEP